MVRAAQILVADDDESSVRFLKRLLDREGPRISVVSTGEEALKFCEDDAPDLVLVDLVAPRGHGFALCSRLKNQSFTRFILS
jgi:CheY-like chemotaxis protein